MSEKKLKDIVFISNSIPKSGSTLLFNLQRDFINRLCGRKECNYSVLADNSVNLVGGFVSAKELPVLLAKIQNGLVFDGPLVLKTHTSITPKLRDLYQNDERIYISTIIRDPLDVVLSAIDNNKKTGEFTQFVNMESACKTVNNFFQLIYDSTIQTKLKPIPVVRYEDLMRNPIECLIRSLHPKLIELIISLVAENSVDFVKSSAKAKHRLQIGGISRDISVIPEGDRHYLLDSIKDFRAKLGYVTK